MSLQKSSPELLTSENDGSSTLSIYTGELSQEVVAKGVARLKAAFPAIPREFYTLLIERLKEKGFSSERFMSSVNNLIDNYQYPNPTMANILSFDKRVKIYCYSEMANIVTSGSLTQDSFSKLKINGKLFWVKASDKEFYNLPEEL